MVFKSLADAIKKDVAEVWTRVKCMLCDFDAVISQHFAMHPQCPKCGGPTKLVSGPPELFGGKSNSTAPADTTPAVVVGKPVQIKPGETVTLPGATVTRPPEPATVSQTDTPTTAATPADPVPSTARDPELPPGMP